MWHVHWRAHLINHFPVDTCGIRVQTYLPRYLEKIEKIEATVRGVRVY